MDYTNHNTSLRTNKHLSYEERFYIEKQLQANVSKSAIAKALGRSRTWESPLIYEMSLSYAAKNLVIGS